MITMTHARMEGPKQLVEVAVRRLLESDLETPIPQELTIGTKRISIADDSANIEAYRAQRHALASHHVQQPTVLLHPNGGGDSIAVPLDLRDGMGERVYLNRSVGPRIESAINRTVALANRAGLSTSQAPTSNADTAFASGLSESVSLRMAQGLTSSGGPPSSSFSVTTDSQPVEILYATGYFVSTQQGFGFSSPAVRTLAWGGYTFGYKVAGVVTFDGTLWTVPSSSGTHLHV